MGIHMVFELIYEGFELGADVTESVFGGCLGEAAVGFSVQVFLQSSADIGITFYDSRAQVLICPDDHESV